MLKEWIFNLLALIVTVLLSTGPATAQTALAGQPVAVCVTRATPGMAVRILFTQQSRFDCTTRQTALGSGDYWVLSAPVRATGPVDIRIGSLWQERVTLHALYADGAIVSAVTDGR